MSMMATTEDRDYYREQFARIHERLDALIARLDTWHAECERRHAHDQERMALLLGNGGKPGLAVRLDRLEQAEPRKRESWTWWMSICALVTSGLLVVVDALAGWFRK